MNPKVLLLTITDQHEHILNRYPGVDLQVNNNLKSWELGFSGMELELLTYDFFENYVNKGIVRLNEEIVALVTKERPDYLVWPAMTFEVLEETFDKVRALGCKVIGVFFDDVSCFDNFTKFYIPHLDYFVTFDSLASKEKYQNVGAEAVFMPYPVSCKYYINKEIPFQYDVSFIGAKIANRESFITHVQQSDINVQTFGRGWDGGYINYEEMINVINASKVNLNFVDTIDRASKQLKGRLFEICMCGGFLLTEYMEELKDCFDIDKEIVCFSSQEEAIEKIRFYLKNEQLRLSIAKAGHEKVMNFYSFEGAWGGLFEKISSGKLKPNNVRPVELSKAVKVARSSWHIAMAYALYFDGKKSIFRDQLVFARRYNPFNSQVLSLSFCHRMPYFLGTFILVLIQRISFLLRKIKSLIKKIVMYLQN